MAEVEFPDIDSANAYNAPAGSAQKLQWIPGFHNSQFKQEKSSGSSGISGINPEDVSLNTDFYSITFTTFSSVTLLTRIKIFYV